MAKITLMWCDMQTVRLGLMACHLTTHRTERPKAMRTQGFMILDRYQTNCKDYEAQARKVFGRKIFQGPSALYCKFIAVS